MNQNQINRQLELRRQPVGNEAGFQRWSDLMFIHWRVDADNIQQSLPDGLTVDTYEGDAYLGLVPFMMTRVKVGMLPIVPWVCAFPETNIRTYVVDEAGNPGVWFYTLDASRLIPVITARAIWHLNYRWSKMSISNSNGKIYYQGKRLAKPHEHYRITGEIAAESKPGPAETGSLEFFLAERYLMFARNRTGQLYSGRVWHTPYNLATAQLVECEQLLTHAVGFELSRTPDHVLYSPGVDTKVYSLQALVQ